jgi:L-iditol 2-dehydrogenase
LKAARLYGVRDLRIEEVPDPEPAAGEVLIQIAACGVCPSDLRAYTGTRAASGGSPRTPGHEWAGVVVGLGEGVADLALGDRVVPDWRVVCGKCYNCRRGTFNYCSDLGRIRGGFAELGVAPATNVRKIPDHVTFEQAAFCEPLACCINGSQASRIGIGDDVAIVGCGPIGLQHLQLARIQGARVIAVDLDERRLEMAKQLGAHDLVPAADGDPVARVKALTDGRGADAVIVAVGDVRAARQAIAMAGLNGRVQLFAGTYPSQEMPLDPNVVHYGQLILTGSHDFTPHHFTTALKLIAYGIIDVQSLISHRYPLERTADALEMTAGRQGLKAMVRMD